MLVGWCCRHTGCVRGVAHFEPLPAAKSHGAVRAGDCKIFRWAVAKKITIPQQFYMFVVFLFGREIVIRLRNNTVIIFRVLPCRNSKKSMSRLTCLNLMNDRCPKAGVPKLGYMYP